MCQFCGAAVAPPPKGAGGAAKASVWHDDHAPVYYGKPKWVWPAYYFICGYFVLSALVSAIVTLSGKRHGFETPLVFIGPVINLVLGVGLALRIEFIRGVVNFVCGLGLVFGVLRLIPAAAMVMALGPIGLLILLLVVFDMVSDAMMIYLIGETD